MGVNEDDIDELPKVVPEELTNKELLKLEQECIAEKKRLGKKLNCQKRKKEPH